MHVLLGQRGTLSNYEIALYHCHGGLSIKSIVILNTDDLQPFGISRCKTID